MGYRILMMICNMNITASVVILGVLLVRVLLRKAPKVFSCALWLVVLFRLLCPISVTTPFSLFGVLGMQNEQTHILEYLPWDVMTAENIPAESVDVLKLEAEYGMDSIVAAVALEAEDDADRTVYTGQAVAETDAENRDKDNVEKISGTEGTRAEINRENVIGTEGTRAEINRENVIGIEGAGEAISRENAAGIEKTRAKISRENAVGVEGAGAEINKENGIGGKTEESVGTGRTEAVNGQEQVSYLHVLFGLITVIWISGMMVMAVYSVVSLWELRKKVSCAVRLQGNIFLADYLATPCVSGVIHPRIYLPSFLREEEQQYILLHEQCHIRHLDYLVKMLAYIALCIYWFNPLVWIAFVLMEDDMEMRCDEVVMGRMQSDIRADYCQSLLGLSVGGRMITSIPLAFGDGNLKKRVKHILSYQQFPLWKSVVAGIVCVIVVVAFCTNPVYAKGTQTDNGNADNRQTISANNFSVSEDDKNEHHTSVSEGGEQDRENIDSGVTNSEKTDSEELDNGNTVDGDTVDRNTINSEIVESRLEERRQRADTLREVSMTEGGIGETYQWFVDNDLYMNGLSDLNYWGFPGRNALPEDIDVEKWSVETIRSYYDDTYIYDIYENQVFLYDRESEELLYTVDLKDYGTPMKPVMWAVCEQSRLYFSVYANGAGMQGSAYLACVDIENGELLWQTDSMICNSSNFLLWDGILICGYGFTEEEDFLYQIDSDIGEVLKQMRVKTMPEVLVMKDQQLYVKCYNQAYVFAYE